MQDLVLMQMQATSVGTNRCDVFTIHGELGTCINSWRFGHVYQLPFSMEVSNVRHLHLCNFHMVYVAPW